MAHVTLLDLYLYFVGRKGDRGSAGCPGPPGPSGVPGRMFFEIMIQSNHVHSIQKLRNKNRYLFPST